MGCGRSSNTGQRVSVMVLSIVKALDEGLDAFFGSFRTGLAARIRCWMELRLAVFERLLRQGFGTLGATRVIR